MRTSALKRFGSYFLDSIIFSIFQIPFVGLFYGQVGNFMEMSMDYERGLISADVFWGEYFRFIMFTFAFTLVAGLVIMTLYYCVLPLFWKGRTVGRHIAGVYLRNQDGSKLSFMKLVVREIVFKMFWWTFTFGIGAFVDFIMVWLRDDKLTIRDIITKTEIIEYEGESITDAHEEY